MLHLCCRSWARGKKPGKVGDLAGFDPSSPEPDPNYGSIEVREQASTG